MEKTKKEQAIKKLQSELKQEKVDDLKRYAPLTPSHPPRVHPNLTYVIH